MKDSGQSDDTGYVEGMKVRSSVLLTRRGISFFLVGVITIALILSGLERSIMVFTLQFPIFLPSPLSLVVRFLEVVTIGGLLGYLVLLITRKLPLSLIIHGHVLLYLVLLILSSLDFYFFAIVVMPRLFPAYLGIMVMMILVPVSGHPLSSSKNNASFQGGTATASKVFVLLSLVQGLVNFFLLFFAYMIADLIASQMISHHLEWLQGKIGGRYFSSDILGFRVFYGLDFYTFMAMGMSSGCFLVVTVGCVNGFARALGVSSPFLRDPTWTFDIHWPRPIRITIPWQYWLLVAVLVLALIGNVGNVILETHEFFFVDHRPIEDLLLLLRWLAIDILSTMEIFSYVVLFNVLLLKIMSIVSKNARSSSLS